MYKSNFCYISFIHYSLIMFSLPDPPHLPTQPEAHLLAYLVLAGAVGRIWKYGCTGDSVSQSGFDALESSCHPCSFLLVGLDMSSQLLLQDQSGHALVSEVMDSYPSESARPKHPPTPVSCLDYDISVRIKMIYNIYKVVYGELYIIK